MKFAMHNWMRQEPIETTIERLHRLGYDGIEISGEPTQYDTSQVARLLEKYQLACWGSHSIMMPGRDLVSEEASVRAETVKYMQACVRMVHELGGSIFVIFPQRVQPARTGGRSGPGVANGGSKGSVRLPNMRPSAVFASASRP